MRAKDKIKLISKWSIWFYEHTETFDGEIGRQLAYLWPAIANDSKIEVDPNSEIVSILLEHDPNMTKTIWSYMDIVPEEQR